MNQNQIEKLWKWAGFEKRGMYWFDPDTGQEDRYAALYLPDLTWENIEKWFVPKLLKKGNISIEIAPANVLFPISMNTLVLLVVFVSLTKNLTYTGRGKSINEAFSEALLKLIESEEKNAKE